MPPSLPWVSRADVSRHSLRHDAWLIVHSIVIDLTAACLGAPFAEAAPWLALAGGDASHLFLEQAGEGGVDTAPHARDADDARDLALRSDAALSPSLRAALHVPARAPTTLRACVALPWWRDARLRVARLTHDPRHLRLVNSLTGEEHRLGVAGEEPVAEMMARAAAVNAHCAAYRWLVPVPRAGGAAGGGGGGGGLVELDPARTLDEQGLAPDAGGDGELDVLLRFADDGTVG